MFKSYQQFVLSKAAQSRPISEQDFHLLHAALGLSTEFLELDLAAEDNECKEELGDLTWYMMLTAEAIDFPVSNLPDYIELGEGTDYFEVFESALEIFVSLVKKHCIYGADKTEELKLKFFIMWRCFIKMVQDAEFAIDEIIAENQDKLNKRYATSFTTQESEDRKDKQQ